MMIDSVICEYAFPMEEIESEMSSPPDWAEFKFQTGSFNKGEFWFDEYTVEEDGVIYKKAIKRELVKDEKGHPQIKESYDGVERIDYSGELNLHGLHFEEDHDFEVEIKLLYYKGELKEIASTDCTKIDNEKRKEGFKKLKNLNKKIENDKNKWWYSFALIHNSVFAISFYIIRYLFASIIKLCWKIENFLRFKI